MAFKTITITEPAYKAAKRMKKDEESFTELFLRIAPPIKVKDIFGLSKSTPEEYDALMTGIKEGRNPNKRDFGRVNDIRTRLQRPY